MTEHGIISRHEFRSYGCCQAKVTLAAGQKVQTGTVGALLVHIMAYDDIVQQLSRGYPVSSEQWRLMTERKSLEVKMAATVPLPKKAGIFDLSTQEEWTGGQSAGRGFVVATAQAGG